MISLENIALDKRLNITNLQFLDQKINILIGPNGAGKSTLLDIITGNISSYGGSVCYEGESITNYSSLELAKRMAYIPQKLDWNNHLKVRDILVFSLYPFQKSPKITIEDERRLNQIIEGLRISNYLERDFGELSGGEQKRVAIASALFQNTPLLILDEPFAALDPLYRKIVADFLKFWSLEYRVSMILSVHDLHMANYIGDYFWCLKEGILFKESSELNEELLSKLYQTPFFRYEKGSEKVFLPGLFEENK